MKTKKLSIIDKRQKGDKSMKKYILGLVVLLYCLWAVNPSFASPDPFSFTDQTGAELNVLVTSNTITLSGIDDTTPVSITAGAYSINGGPYTTEEGTVSDGDTVTVQLTSSGSYTATTEATLTIGDVSDTFSITTKSEFDALSDSHDDCGHCDHDGHCEGGCNCEGAVHCDGDDHCHCEGLCYCDDDDDDHVFITCFIATAAFGSPLAKQVRVLQQFRDRYLLPNALGKKFVAWYYHYGPVAANWIKDKPLAKAAVRAALYPLIGISFLLISGTMPFAAAGFLLSVLIYLRLRPKKPDVR